MQAQKVPTVPLHTCLRIYSELHARRQHRNGDFTRKLLLSWEVPRVADIAIHKTRDAMPFTKPTDYIFRNAPMPCSPANRIQNWSLTLCQRRSRADSALTMDFVRSTKKFHHNDCFSLPQMRARAKLSSSGVGFVKNRSVASFAIAMT